MLPGSRDVLHLFQPDWVKFFDTLIREDQMCYGHFMCGPDNSTVSTGTLMVILAHHRLDNGRILVISQATSRIRCESPSLQTGGIPNPNLLLDCSILPDLETTVIMPGQSSEARLAAATAWDQVWAKFDMPVEVNSKESVLDRDWAKKGADALAPFASIKWESGTHQERIAR